MIYDIEKLYPGLILADDLYSVSNGNIPLLPKGRVLTQSDINNLKKNSVKEVQIKYIPGPDAFNNSFKNQMSANINAFKKMVYDDELNYKYSKKMDTINFIKGLANDYVEVNNDIEEYYFDVEKYISVNSNYSHDVEKTDLAVALTSIYNKSVGSMDRISIRQVAFSSMISDVGTLCKDVNILKNIRSRFYMDIMKKKKEGVFPGVPDDVFDKYDEKYVSLYGSCLMNKYGVDPISNWLLLFGNEHFNERSDGALGRKILKSDNDKKNIIMLNIIKVASRYDELLKEHMPKIAQIKEDGIVFDPRYECASKMLEESKEGEYLLDWTTRILTAVPMRYGKTEEENYVNTEDVMETEVEHKRAL